MLAITAYPTKCRGLASGLAPVSVTLQTPNFIRKLGHNARTFHTIQQPQFDGGSRYSRPLYCPR